MIEIPVEKKTVKRKTSDKPTKKAVAMENRVLKDFDNMCGYLESMSPAFIATNVETLERAKPTLSDKAKQYVSDKAFEISVETKTNSKIILPDNWVNLFTFTE